jgi:hypothetical protein
MPKFAIFITPDCLKPPVESVVFLSRQRLANQKFDSPSKHSFTGTLVIARTSRGLVQPCIKVLITSNEQGQSAEPRYV